MNSLGQDLRHSLRILLTSPGFTAVAVIALALGIGANTAIFSVVDRVLLRPLPFKDPDQLMRVQRGFRQGGGGSVSIPKFTVWKQHNQVFEYLCAFDFAGPGLNLSGGDSPEQVKAIRVSAEFFPVFGVVPVVGRTFSFEEDRPGGPRVAVVSHGLWKRRFGGDPGLVGGSINLNGEPFTVAGILPSSFQPYPAAEIWLPLQPDPNSTNQGHFLLVAGRLKPGVTLEAARSQMKLVGEQFRRQYPQWMGSEESVAVVPFQESLVGNIRPALFILFGAVGFVLLIACANVANLLLARASARKKEIAIRNALGASRKRIIRQLLTESVLLASVGGGFGLLLGHWGLRALLAFSPGNLPRAQELITSSSLDARVLAFTLAVSFLTGVLFGLAPAFQTSKADLNSTLKESSGRGGTGRHRALGVLVASEMALALVLLTGAALLIRTFTSLRGVKPGFEPRRVLTMKTSLSGAPYASTARVEDLTTRIIQRIESLPGVEAAASSINLPLEEGPDLPFTIEGRPLPDGRYHGDEYWRSVSPHYFAALKIPLLRGRSFDERDSSKAPRVVIINDAMAKKYWPKEDPIGQQITIGRGLGPEFEEPARQVVGVVGDVREAGLQRPPAPIMYIPHAQVSDSLMRLGNRIVPTAWIVRTSVDPLSLTAAIRQEFLTVDRELAVASVRTMEQVIADTMARQSFNAILLSVFAGIALLLAAVGIYGVMSYSVEQRTHEIGIRMALGAGRLEVLRLVVGQGMRLAGIGVIIGLAAAFGLTRLLASFLFGVKPHDPATFGVVAAILSGIALLASYVPARRATRVDPILALRYE